MIWCDGVAIIRTQWCGSGVVIHWTAEQDHESIATAAGRYGSLYYAEIIGILKALKAVSEKLTDSAIAVRIHLHSNSRQELKQHAKGPAIQHERIGWKIWGKLVATTKTNMENVVLWYGYQDMKEWREMSGQTRWWKREVDQTSQRQTLTWDQRSSTCGSSLCSHGRRNLMRWLKANWLALQHGIWDAVMVNSAPEYLLVFHGWRREQSRLRLNRLTSRASCQAFIGQIKSPICPHCENGEETAEDLLLFCPKWAAEH